MSHGWPKKSVRIREEKERRRPSLWATGTLPSRPIAPYVPVPNERHARIAFREQQRTEREAAKKRRFFL